MKYTAELRGNAFDDAGVDLRLERIPADVWNFQAAPRQTPRSAPTASCEHAQSEAFRRLFAALEQPLHPKADAEQRLPIADQCREWHRTHGAVERARRAKMTHSRHDHASCAHERTRLFRHEKIGAHSGEGLLDRCQIAGTVIDEAIGSSQQSFR